MKHVSQESRFPGQYLNLGLHEYKAEVLSTQRQRSVEYWGENLDFRDGGNMSKEKIE